MRLRKTLGTVSVNIIAWIISLIMLIPLVLILFNSMKTSLEAAEMSLMLPSSIQWENFAIVIEKGKLVTAFLSSALYSIGSVLVTTILASMAAYVLARRRSRLHNFLYMFIALGITMPINYVALMKVMQFFHLNNTVIFI